MDSEAKKTPPWGQTTTWTVESLRELMHLLLNERDGKYEQRFLAQEKASNIAAEAAQRALSKAEVAMEKRSDSVNEFRATLQDQASKFIPRAEVEVEMRAMRGYIEEIKNVLSEGRGTKQADQSTVTWNMWALGIVVAIASVVASVLTSFVLKK